MCRSSGTQVLIVMTSGRGRGAGNAGSGKASQRLAPGHISGIMLLHIWPDVRSTVRCGQDATSKNLHNDSMISCATSWLLEGQQKNLNITDSIAVSLKDDSWRDLKRRNTPE